ncbi:hypothetical protein PS1_015467 [Malus domestica]
MGMDSVTTRKVFLRTLYAVAICSHQDLRNHQAEQVGLKKGSGDNICLSRYLFCNRWGIRPQTMLRPCAINKVLTSQCCVSSKIGYLGASSSSLFSRDTEQLKAYNSAGPAQSRKRVQLGRTSSKLLTCSHPRKRATTWSSAGGDLLYLGRFDNSDLRLFLLKLA